MLLVGFPHDHPEIAHLIDSQPQRVREAIAAEGYVLDITPDRVMVAAERAAGAYYGVTRLVEILSRAAERESPVPCAKIVDWPAMRRRGLHVLLRSGDDLSAVLQIIGSQMPALRLNELILEINYFFEFRSHPECAAPGALTREECALLKAAADKSGVRIIPMINCLGHQSWADTTYQLLVAHPEFDETPGMVADKEFYCRSWCPSHPEVNALVFDLIDELIDVFDATAFHAGMDEVFVLGQCPRCKDTPAAELFAKSVCDIHAHIAGKRGLEMQIWGDRLLDSEATHYGVWEASGNGTSPAIDLIPKDIVICDWHYEMTYGGRPATYPSVRLFQDKGFRVWPSGWNSAENARAVAECALSDRTDKMEGYLATTWVGVTKVAGALAGDEASLAAKNAAGVADAIRVGARIAWEGDQPAGDIH